MRPFYKSALAVLGGQSTPAALAPLLLQDANAPQLTFWRRISSLHPWLVYAAEMALLLAAVWAFRYFAVRRLRKWAERRDSLHHNQMVSVTVRALTPMLLIAIIAIALNLLDLPPRFLGLSDRLLYIATIVVVIYFASKILQVLISRWFATVQGTGAKRSSVEFFMRIIFGIVATLFVLDNLNVQLKAIWTTLGVGGVAVALALQDTLTNFFAGVYLRLDNSVEPGDYIQIEGSQEGFVNELGWRSTRMRTLSNQLVVVPNTKLATTPFTNYSVTNAEESTVLAFKISREANPEAVKQLLIDEAQRAAKDIPEISLDPGPTARHVPKLGEQMQDYTLTVHVRSSRDRFNVHFALRSKIFERLAKEGIAVEGAPTDAKAGQAAAKAPAKVEQRQVKSKAVKAQQAVPRAANVDATAGNVPTEEEQRVLPEPEKRKAAASAAGGSGSAGDGADGPEKGSR
jgi:small-conductance mechanosensitive channel